MKTFLFLTTLFFINSQSIEEIRSAFHKAHHSKESAVEFNSTVAQIKLLNEDLHSAYLGASEALLSKFGRSPGEKLKLFKSGKAHLEKAVENQPQNIEIRMIRLIIQHNAPSILKYNNEIETDKAFIIQHFSSANAEVKKFIQNTAKSTGVFTQEELTKIK